MPGMRRARALVQMAAETSRLLTPDAPCACPVAGVTKWGGGRNGKKRAVSF